MECATCAAVQANIRAVKDKAIETGKLVAVMQARKVALETAYGEVEEIQLASRYSLASASTKQASRVIDAQQRARRGQGCCCPP